MFVVKLGALIFYLTATFYRCSAKETSNEVVNKLARGFGDDIEWISWNEAIDEAKSQKKPIFLLIHKTWCGACQALKTTFTTSSMREEFVKISRNFVMVNTEDQEEPADEKYSPDGGYIPRILFLDSNGNVMKEVDNSIHYPSNKHYFPQMPTLIKAMKSANELFSSKIDEAVVEQNEEQSSKEKTDETTEASDDEETSPQAEEPDTTTDEAEKTDKAKEEL